VTHAFVYFLSLIAARTSVIFAVLLVLFRILGKRQIGQMNIYDLAMTMAIANAVQNAMTNGNGNLTAGMVCSGTLLLLGAILTRVFVKLPLLEQRMVGTPTVLVNRGTWMESALRREKVTHEEVLAAMRQHGVADISAVAIAMLEVDGSISIVPKTEVTHKLSARLH
jgi:uncharacterized membrane protein YcaP (DUF421 family)